MYVLLEIDLKSPWKYLLQPAGLPLEKYKLEPFLEPYYLDPEYLGFCSQSNKESLE